MEDPMLNGSGPGSPGHSSPAGDELGTAQLDAASEAFLNEVRTRWSRSRGVLAGTTLIALISPLVAVLAGLTSWSSTMGAWFVPGFFEAPNF